MMVEVKIKDLITAQISGEWGDVPKKDKGVFVIRTTNFQNDGNLNLDDVVKREVSEKKILAKRLQKGDVIIEKSGGSPNQPVGRVVFFDEDTDMPYLTNNFTTILRPDQEKVFPLYFHYLMMRNYQLKKVLKYQNKTTGIINLKLEKYLNSKVKIHENKNEQIAHAIFLTKINKISKNRELGIKLLDELIESKFLELFGDPVANEKNWGFDVLENVVAKDCPLTYGIVQPGDEFKNGVSIVRPVDLVSDYIGTIGLKKIDPEISHKFSRTVLKGNEILMCVRGTTGVVSISLPELIDSNVTRGITPIWFDENIHLKFAFYLFKTKSFRRLIESKTYGVGLKQINLKELRQLNFIKPEEEIQKKFIEIVDILERLKNKYVEHIFQLDRLLNSFNQESFNDNINFKSIDIDHILPKSKGGSSNFENLTITPKSENKPIIDETFSSFDGIVESDDLEPLTEIKYAQPARITEEDINQLITDLDNELKFRKEVPCVADYIKHKIIKGKLKKSFLFEDLWNALEQTPFVEHPTYDMVRNWIFQEIREKNIKQLFDGRGKKLKLQLVK